MLSTPLKKTGKGFKTSIDKNLLNLGGKRLLTEKFLTPKKG